MSAAEPVTDPAVREYDLVVSLGTDHHPFDRLLDWCEDYALARPGTRCHIQHGFTKAPQRCTGVERMPREQLLETYRGAAAVLVQGGPGSILDAREAGIVPVAVPRRQDLGEVVDDHQIQFTRIMAEQGEAVMATSREELFDALDRALAQPEAFRTAPRLPHPEQAARKLEDSLTTLLEAPSPPRRRFPRRLMQLLSRPVRPLPENR
ncbi:hypothetical protein [Rothia kristinae]|uniref:Glycosyl transferase n=2 Tax=Rothia kristinae TaxID=37923 RepID=A0A7T3CI21_9MICC|nr:hypothetical protein [Rothia kristinae]QPT53028.1 glycosyl transferase [Rothia kristinae]SIM05473.1 protein CpsH [Mycobacteroides abscessus subsp. abscessus]